MSIFQTPARSSQIPHFLTTMVDTIVSAYALAMQAGQIRSDRRHLQEMPDYMLSDIGINRSEIDSVVGLRGRDPSRRVRG